MTAALTPTPKFTPLDSNGNIMPGAKLFTYDAGTTTKKNTWKDSAKSTLNTNPIILDSAGRADVWGDGSYKLVLAPSTDTDPPTSPIWTVDNINIYNSLDWDGLTSTIPQFCVLIFI